MSDNPNQPPSPKGPWLYSGVNPPTPAYTPPPTSSPTPAPTPTLASDSTLAAITPTHTQAVPHTPVKPDDASLASIIDTIEAIIIALILALTFRAFIIEAFVIPTGSMAPTLLGAHINVVCPECGYTYTRDLSLRFQQYGLTLQDFGSRGELTSNTLVPVDGDDTASLICPNCQYLIPYEKLPQFLENRRITDVRAKRGDRLVPFAWANNGDRILVLKYIYSIMDPHRFDVIVFKEPMMARDNFIKRLIGLPRETIEIIGGDIYVGPPGKTDAADRVIARKPLYIQKDLWELVYDNDFYPIDEGAKRPRENQLPASFGEWHNPWVGQGPTADAWDKKPEPGKPYVKTVGGPVIHFTAGAAGVLAFNPEHNDPYTYNILGYNNDINDLYRGRSITLMPVGDIRLETTWTPAAAAGQSVALDVGAGNNRYKVTWSKDGLELLHYDVASKTFTSVQKVAPADQPAPRAGVAYNIALNNVDHGIQFFIDGKMVLAHETPWNAVQAHKDEDDAKAIADARNGSLLDALAPHIDISVGGACTIGHLKVLRDLYYTQTEQTNGGRYPGAANSHLPLTLGPDEYFAMGDNSRRSHDGRTWAEVFPALDDLGTRRGIVPARYLLGKAIFVYWPAGFRFSDNIPILNRLPLAPNTGEMRFIR